jgi:methylated-DNA-[protein]-cysteine S-methyltransferase
VDRKLVKVRETLLLDRLPTPIGAALLVFDREARLRAFEWEEARLRRLLRPRDAVLEEARAPRPLRRALEAYFLGDLAAVEDISCEAGGTPFQRAVWRALRAIPAGRTLSYGALAAQLGAPAACRAVGHANGANPISVVIPCHRLIGAGGELTGYSGGLARKRWLLEHEGALPR